MKSVIKHYEKNDGIYEVTLTQTNKGIETTVIVNDWTIGQGNKQFRGVAVCPVDKVFDEELEFKIAKNKAEIKHIKMEIEAYESERISM